MPRARLLPVLWLLALALVSATACIDPGTSSHATPTATRPPEATTTPQSQRPPVLEGVIPAPPDADRFAAVRRLKLHSPVPIPAVVNPEPVSYDVGHVERFWVADLDSYRHFEVEATLRLVTPHAYWYVDQSVDIPQEDLERSAREFEGNIYPSVTRYFGPEWVPGVDNDTRLTILNTRFQGAAGYFSSADEYPKAVHPFSNEREMIYIDVASLKPGTRAYHNVLAHELQHAAHWRADATEESWVNEGLAVLAEDLAGFPVGLSRIFAANPDIQLTDWQQEPRQNAAHYAAAYLFMKYLGQHYGGYGALKGLVDEQADDIEGINRFLQTQGYAERFVDVFRDWVIANFLDEYPAKEDRYHYADLAVRAQPARSLTRPEALTATIRQVAAHYLEIRPQGSSVRVTFEAPTTVKLLPNDPRSGRSQWWSNRGDSIHSTLTRTLDLTGVPRATLRFWAWYDIEQNWDHAYVTVSEDSGQTWTALPATSTTGDNPVGNALGPAFTGASGGGQPARWVEETVDLTPFAGKKVLARFEYITDEAVNQNGFAIDDIRVPEIGYADDAETDGGWDARGFVRTENHVPQYFLLQLIEFGTDITVRQIPLNEQNEATIEITRFGEDLNRAVLVVAALAPVTTQPASYELTMTQGP
ncbi:MAG: immune inhibitor A [Chloroflexi bacterium]|nr:immune inhibitor A [Chloroflexota bacterium]